MLSAVAAAAAAGGRSAGLPCVSFRQIVNLVSPFNFAHGLPFGFAYCLVGGQLGGPPSMALLNSASIFWISVSQAARETCSWQLGLLLGGVPQDAAF